MAVDVGGWVNSRMKRLVLEMVKSRSKRSAAVVDKIMGIGRGGGGKERLNYFFNTGGRRIALALTGSAKQITLFT